MLATVEYDTRYRRYFECFNQSKYFEAHEVLEELWLKTTGQQRDFYKGLIQTAAAFLKLKQGKPDPAARLAGRAMSHLQNFEPAFEGLDVSCVVLLLREIQSGRNPLSDGVAPQLRLQDL